MNKYESQKLYWSRSRTGKWLKCETCSTTFYVTAARIRQVTANGHQIKYCSMACYKKHGTNNPFWGKRHSDMTKVKWAKNPGRNRFKPFHNPNERFLDPSFVGKGKTWWQNKLRSECKACQQCGWDIVPEVLQLHHVDRNRRNNTRTNLLLLCPNCHETQHFLAGDGLYTKHKKVKKSAAA